MKKIILLFCLLLLTSGAVSANPVDIQGIGQVELGKEITMTEVPDKKGDISYSFKVKDGTVWRAVILKSINDMPNSISNNIIKMDGLLNKIADEKFSKKEDFLSSEKAKLITLNGKEGATNTIKMSMPVAGIVVNMDTIIISEPSGLKLFMFMCADSDAQYWRPIMQKIVAN